MNERTTAARPPAWRRIANACRESYVPRRICAALAALFVLSAAVAAAPVGALAQDVYTVAKVEVDETSETAARAREQAIARGHSIAFDRLIARLVPREQRTKLPRLSATEIASFVLSFGIDEEKRSDVRYLASMTFRFRQEVVRGHFQAHGVAFAETMSKPAMILPVYSYAGALLLWDDPNPWFEAWKSLPRSDGLVPLILPAGDLADISDISANQAIDGAEARLTAIADRYGANGVVVAIATLGLDDASGARKLTVSTKYHGVGGGDRSSVRSYAMQSGDTLSAVIARAARSTAIQIEDSWKQENLLRFDRLSELTALVPVSELREWVEIRKRLAQVAFLSGSQLVTVSRREMAVRLRYYGAASQLQVALLQRDLSLEQSGGLWVLRDSRAPQPAPASGGGTEGAGEAEPAPSPDDDPPSPAQPGNDGR